MTPLKEGLMWGLAFITLGVPPVYILSSGYLGFLDAWAGPVGGIRRISILAIIITVLVSPFILLFEEPGLHFLIIANLVLLFFSVGFFARLTASKIYERDNPDAPFRPVILLFLWVIWDAFMYSYDAINGTFSGSVLEFWTSSPSRLVFFLLGPILWVLYNFNLSIIEPRRGDQKNVRPKRIPWRKVQKKWMARAMAASTEDEKFEVIDELFFYSEAEKFPMDPHIVIGFDIYEEQIDLLLNAWSKDRQQTPRRLPTPSVPRRQEPWRAARNAWYAKARAARSNKEEAFEALDELHEFSVAGRFYIDLHVKRGFDIGEEAKETLLNKWAADRGKRPIRLSDKDLMRKLNLP